MKNTLISQEKYDLCSRIYIIREVPVMLDFDLAEIYGYEVKRLNEQVKRNITRFPEDFMFQLTRAELDLVKSQFATSPKALMFSGQDGGVRKLPYAFTEQGIYMLATVLRGELADQQSIFIMRAFRELKHYVLENRQFVTRNEMRLLENSVLTIAEKQQKSDAEIKKICENIDKINENFANNTEFKNFVVYRGQKFEADVAYTDIYHTANKSIYVIDDYVNIKTLDLLKHRKPGVEVILFTQNGNGKKGFLTESEVQDFNSQYPRLSVKPNPECHDRFIIIDYKTSDEKVFHCGASSKDAGKKVCAINKFEDTTLIYPIMEKLLAQKERLV
ncbi:ORF6N domain-containing protein [bacterium]|nr:ORF6N domain-containing protein [bacterium]MBP5591627.1 ORF6N domain-containing protein [bacterium]